LSSEGSEDAERREVLDFEDRDEQIMEMYLSGACLYGSHSLLDALETESADSLQKRKLKTVSVR